MLNYDKYTKKVIKNFNNKRKLKKLRWLFISIGVVFASAVIALMILKGSVVGDISLSNDHFTYGDSTLTPDAEVFFGSVSSYEYYNPTTNEWSEVQPTEPGTYKVRAVTNGIFGKKKSNDVEFTISARPTKLTLSPGEMEYGEYPSVTNLSINLIEGDILIPSSVEFEIVNFTSLGANFKVKSIRIEDRYGNDVTYLYNFEYPVTQYTLTKKTILVSALSSDKVYDNQAYSYDGSLSENTMSQLAYGDTITTEFNTKLGQEILSNMPKEAGTYSILSKDAVIKHGDTDVSRFYDISYVESPFKILKRDIEVYTGSSEKTYDGLDINKLDEFGITLNSKYELLTGHSLKVDGDNYTTIKNAGTYENRIKFNVVDELGNDYTSNYNITYDYGKLKINKLAVSIAPNVYSNKEYNGLEYDVLNNIENNFVYNEGSKHFLVEDKFYAEYEIRRNGERILSNPKDAGEYTISISRIIANEGDINNYEIEMDKVTSFTISKRTVQIMISTEAGFEFGGTKTYDGSSYNVGQFVWNYKEGSNEFLDGETLSINNAIVINNTITNSLTNETTTEVTTVIKDAGKYNLSIDETKFLINNGNVSLDNYNIILEDYSSVKEMVILPVNITVSPLVQSDIEFNETGVSYEVNDLNYELVSGSFVSEDEKNGFRIVVKYENQYNGELIDTAYDSNRYKMIITDCIMKSGYRVTNYNISLDNTKEFNITKKAVTIKPNVDSLNNLVYDGNPHTYSGGFSYVSTKHFNNGDNIKFDVEFYNSSELSDMVNAGDYKIKIKEDTLEFTSGNKLNYDISFETLDVTIEKRNITIMPNEMNSVYYSSMEISYSNEYSNFRYEDGSMQAVDRLKIFVKFNGSDSVKDAGTYTLTISRVEFEGDVSSNYIVNYSTSLVEFTINKANLIIKPLDLETKEYDGLSIVYDSSKYLVISGELFDNDEIKVNVGYYLNDTPVTPINANINNEKYTIKIESVSFVSGNSNNYNIDISNTSSFIINKRMMTISLIDILDREYDGYATTYSQTQFETNKPFPAGDSVTLNLKYYQGSVEVIPINAGTYTLRIDSLNYYLDTNNYEFDYSSNIDFTINKRDLSISLKDLSLNEYVFNGNSQDVFNKSSDYIIESGSLAIGDNLKVYVDYLINEEKVLNNEPINANSYTYKYNTYRINDAVDNNYSISVVTDSGNFSIKPLDVTIKPRVDYSIVYSGNLYEFEVVQSNFDYVGLNTFLNNDTLTIKSVTYDNDPINVGNYEMSVNEYEFVKGNNSSIPTNYNINLEKNNFSIVKANIKITYSNYLDSGFEYDSNEYTYDNTKFSYVDSVNHLRNDNHNILIDVKFIDSSSNVLSSIKNAGNYTLSFSSIVVMDNGNDISSNYNIEFVETLHQVNISRRYIYITPGNIVHPYSGTVNTYDFMEDERNYVYGTLKTLCGNDKIVINTLFTDNLGNTVNPVEVGKYNIIVDGYTFTGDDENNYTFVLNGLENGLEITKKEIKITYNYSATGFEYDGLSHNYNPSLYSYASDNYKLVDGHYIVMAVSFKNTSTGEITSSIINKGEYQLLFDRDNTHIYDSLDNEVTSNYFINFIEPDGGKKVTIADITLYIKPVDIIKKYDGTEYGYSSNEWEYTTSSSNRLLDEINEHIYISKVEFYTLEDGIYYLTNNYTNAGTYYVKIAEYTVDNSSNYVINTDTYGEFTVTKRDMVINLTQVADETFDLQVKNPYDKYSYVFVSGDNILANEQLTIYVDYYNSLGEEISPVDVGTYTYKYRTYKVLDNLNNDLSNNYNITVNNGSGLNFRILPASITVTIVPLSDMVYRGTTIYPNVQFNYNNSDWYENGCVLYFEYEFRQGVNVVQPLNAGTYTVHITSVSIVETDFQDTEIDPSYHTVSLSNYDIDYTDTAEFIINPCPIKISPIDYNLKEYDGIEFDYLATIGNTFNYLTNARFFNDDRIELLSFNYSDTPLYAKTYDVYIGTYSFIGSSASNYAIDISTPSTLTIQPRYVTIDFTNLSDKIYDGVSITYPVNEYSYVNGSNELLSGHTLSFDYKFRNILYNVIQYDFSIVDAGEYIGTIDNIHVYDELMNNITESYSINLNRQDIPLTIYRRSVEAPSPDTTEYYYNSNPQTYNIALSELYTVNNRTFTDAGTYPIILTLNDPTNYYFTITDEYIYNNQPTILNNGSVQYSFVINKLNVTIKPFDDTKVYDGLAHTYPQYYGNAEEVIVPGANHFLNDDLSKVMIYHTNETLLATSIKNVGTYVITILSLSYLDDSIETNYNISYEPAEYTITKANLVIKVKDLSTTEFIYNGQTQNPLDYINNFDIISGSLGFYESLKIGISYSDVPKNSGLYQYSYDASGNIFSSSATNYDITCTITDGYFTIKKADITFSYNKVLNKEYDGVGYLIEQIRSYSVTSGMIMPGDSYIMDINLYNELDNMVNVAVDAGNYRVRHTITSGLENYNVTFEDYDFNIYKRNVTISFTNNPVTTYNGSEQLLDQSYVYVSSGSFVSLESFYAQFKYMIGLDTVSPINAGSYTVSIDNVLIDNGSILNYNIDYSSTCTYTINKKDITIKPVSISKEYDGNSYDYLVDKSGLVDFVGNGLCGTDSIIITGISYSPSDTKNVGNKTMSISTYSINGISSNYNIHLESSSLEITKKSLDIELPTYSSKTYDGIGYYYGTSSSNYELINSTSLISGDTLNITVKFYNQNTLATIDTAINAGTYSRNQTAIIRDSSLADVTNNYDITFNDNEFEIRYIEVEIPEEDNTRYIYNGSTQTYNISSNEFYTVIGGSRVDANTYTVTVSLNSTNYSWNDGSKNNIEYSFVIERRTIDVPPVDNNTYIYTGSTIRYGIDDSPYYSITNNEKIDANEYTVTVSLNDITNYKWSDETDGDKNYPFIIQKHVVNKPLVGTDTHVYDGAMWVYNPIEKEAGDSLYYTVSENSKVNVGLYSAFITLNDASNYKWDDGSTGLISHNYTITKARLVIKVKDPVNTNLTYNASKQYPYPLVSTKLSPTSISFTNLSSNDSLTDYEFKFYDKETGYESDTYNALTYTYKLLDTSIKFYNIVTGESFNYLDNYYVDDESVFENEFTINKYQYNIVTPVGPLNDIYDGGYHSPQTELTIPLEYDEKLILSYNFINTSTSELTKKIKDVGVYNYFVDLSETAIVAPYGNPNTNTTLDNYNLTITRSEDCYYEIEKRTITIAPHPLEKTYTGDVIEYSYTRYDEFGNMVNYDLATATTLLTGMNLRIIPENIKYYLNGTVETLPINVGTYTMILDNSSYELIGSGIENIQIDFDNTQTLVIERQSIDFPYASLDTNKDFVLEYTGEPQTFVKADSESRYVLRRSEFDQSAPDYFGTEKGTYHIYISLGSNYKWSDELPNDFDCSYQIVNKKLNIKLGVLKKEYDGTPFSLSKILEKATIKGFINGDTSSSLTITDLPTQVNATSSIPYNLTITGPSYYDIVIDTANANLTIDKKKIVIKPIQYESRVYTGDEYDSYDVILENNYPLIFASGKNYVQTGEFIETAPDYIITYRIVDNALHTIVTYDGTTYSKPFDSKEPWQRGTYTIQALSLIDPSTKNTVSFSTNYNVQLLSTTFNIGNPNLTLTTKKVTYDGLDKTPLDFITISKFNGSDVKIYGLKFVSGGDLVRDASSYEIDFSNATYTIVSSIDYSETPIEFDNISIDGNELGTSYPVTLNRATLSIKPLAYSKTYDGIGIILRQNGLYSTEGDTLVPNNLVVSTGLAAGQTINNIYFESEDIDFETAMFNSDAITYKVSDGIIVLDEMNDVTHNYTIKYQYATISIKPVKLTVRTLSSNEYYNYDGLYHKGNISISIISGSLVGTDTLAIDPSYEGYKTAGNHRADCVMIIGNDSNYTIDIDKTYRINIEKVDLYIDYTNQSNPVVTGLIGSDHYSAEDSSIKGTFGTGLNTFNDVRFSTMIYDSLDEYVTNCYNIYYIYNGYQKAPDGTVTKIS